MLLMPEQNEVVVGAFGEGSDDLHALIHHLASSRVRVAGPQKGKRGQVRSEEAELALTTAFLRRTLSLVGVRAQARLLLGRLEVTGPGAISSLSCNVKCFKVNALFLYQYLVLLINVSKWKILTKF